MRNFLRIWTRIFIIFSHLKLHNENINKIIYICYINQGKGAIENKQINLHLRNQNTNHSKGFRVKIVIQHKK